MKGFIADLIGQNTGIMFVGGYGFQADFDSALGLYNVDRRRTEQIKNCLAWLVEYGWVTFDQDDAFRNFSLDEDNPLTLEDLLVPGRLYYFDDFFVLAPDWRRRI